MSRFLFSIFLFFCHVLVEASAESTVLQLALVDGSDVSSLYGSVVGVSSDFTTYAIQCLDDSCLLPSTNFPFTQGPSTAVYTIFSDLTQGGLAQRCLLGGTDLAICTLEGTSRPITITYDFQTTGTHFNSQVLSEPIALVTITGGISLLSGISATAAPTVTTPGASSTSAPTSSATTSNTLTAGTASSTTSPTTATSTTSASSSSSKGSAPTAAPQTGSSFLAMAALGLYYAL